MIPSSLPWYGQLPDRRYLKYRLPSGRQVQRKLGPAWAERSRPPAGFFTRKMAEAELAAILTDVRPGEIPDPGATMGRTFGDAVAEWLRYIEHERGRRASTVRDYRNTAHGALLPEFGEETALEALTTERLDQYRARLLTEGKLSRRTIQKQMVLLHGIFKRAKSLRWIPTNPADDIERVSVRRSGEFNVLSVEQVETVACKAEGMFAAASPWPLTPDSGRASYERCVGET